MRVVDWERLCAVVVGLAVCNGLEWCVDARVDVELRHV